MLLEVMTKGITLLSGQSTSLPHARGSRTSPFQGCVMPCARINFTLGCYTTANTSTNRLGTAIFEPATDLAPQLPWLSAGLGNRDRG